MNDELKSLERFFTNHNARRHLLLYLRERNGLLIWKAFAEYRSAGLPVPDNILAKFDEGATALLCASSDAEIARAIEAGTVGRKTAKLRLRVAEKGFVVMEQMTVLEKELGKRPMDAARAVADQYNLSPEYVKVIKHRWTKREKPPRKRTTSGADLQDAWKRQTRK